MGYLHDLFALDGYLGNLFDVYEPRKGQIELAVTIDYAIRAHRHVLGEGPCGTGKGVAYLAPSIRYTTAGSVCRTLICTETHALQEQLMMRDLPMLEKVLPYKFSYALLKGRNNYLCLRKADEVKPWNVVGSNERCPPEARIIESWITKTGDRSELSSKPRNYLWGLYSSTSDECIGRRCPHKADCYYNRAKRIAAESDIIISNFHMLMANLQYNKMVLPEFDILVCDEAHRLASVARDCLGFGVSYFAIRRVVSWLRKHAGRGQLAENLDTAARMLFDRIALYAKSQRYKDRLMEPGFVDASQVVDCLMKARRVAAQIAGIKVEENNDNIFDEMLEKINADDVEKGVAEKVFGDCERIIKRLKTGISQEDDRNVYYLEEHLPKGWYSIEARPVEVGGILNKQIFSETPTVVLVSATMTTGGNFNFIRREVGAPDDALEIVGSSAFDWTSQCRFIIPQGIPDPPTGYYASMQERRRAEQEWYYAIADTLEEVVQYANGRTLALFTSKKSMNFAADKLRAAKLPGSLLVQTPGVTLSKLVEQFRAEPESVLLGVASLWTGIDVPGEALSVVFVDKLPFPIRGDPVVQAICNRYDTKYGPWSGFNMYMVPMAIMQLRQGVGRLLRCQTDRGVVVLCDRRLLTKPYRQQFLCSLPPMMALDQLDDISEFLAS